MEVLREDQGRSLSGRMGKVVLKVFGGGDNMI